MRTRGKRWGDWRGCTWATERVLCVRRLVLPVRGRAAFGETGQVERGATARVALRSVSVRRYQASSNRTTWACTRRRAEARCLSHACHRHLRRSACHPRRSRTRAVYRTSLGVRRLTGGEQRMKESYGEGVATHAGPESCVGVGEALTAVPVGQPSSREIRSLRDADAVPRAEGDTGRAVIARSASVPRSLRPCACTEVLHTGSGRSRVWLGTDHESLRRLSYTELGLDRRQTSRRTARRLARTDSATS